MSGETDLPTLLSTMEPALHEGAYEFVTVVDPSADMVAEALAVVREAEGVTLVQAMEHCDASNAMAWITLTVHSSLHAVGLTAAVAAALAAREIPCNVVAGFHHDHLFVPYPRRFEALRALRDLA